MSSATAAPARPSGKGFLPSIDNGSGKAQAAEGISLSTFFTSLIGGLAVFGIELLLFLLIKGKYSRIYLPRTYLVPERERTTAPPKGLWQWIHPIFHTSNSEFIQKCGLDAYFFLRYLRTLLKIFLPLAFVILPILLPMNTVHGRGPQFATGKFARNGWTNVSGMDILGWGNVHPWRNNRYWAYLILAVFVVVYTCFVVFEELRGYIRIRQAYLTSPQHRLRASATTVLVSAIPRKWCTFEALKGLYDVFPGGVRNIWINRNFDELNDKVNQRVKLARALESAETALIRKASKVHLDRLDTEKPSPVDGRKKLLVLIPVVGEGLEAVDYGLGTIGQRVFEGLKRVERVVDDRLKTTGGFYSEKEADQQGLSSSSVPHRKQDNGATGATGNVEDDYRHIPGQESRQPVPREVSDETRAPDDPNQNVLSGISNPKPDSYEGDDFVLGSHLVLSDRKKKKEEDYDPDEGEPVWRKYLADKDRETMRLPIFGWQWMPSLPLIGKKVDTIDYCRKEVARLNVEIEQDQQEPEKFPPMNSAFIQFNHQVAAHMACQAISHHMPNQMAPRVVEISPRDVVWENLSIKWWESYLRTGGVIVAIFGLIILWGIPVTFTGLLSQINYLAQQYHWLAWLNRTPRIVLSILQGVLPQALLAALLVLLPVILRFLIRSQGGYTGMTVELTVQVYYFAVLFIQVFLVVSISSGISTILTQIYTNPSLLPQILATNLPKASNYFFSYLLLQALSVSAGALVQVLGLIEWFVLAPLLDKTARQKWTRQTKLPDVQWGTFFPVYTNLAVIGTIYSIISPLILVFNIITFSLFWLVYRYNTLYVTKFRFDTGGLLYPTAINQLFTGLYVMEICLIGLFLLVRNATDQGIAYGTPCKGQAIIMAVVFTFTVLYQWLLNRAFGPLFRYLPINLEDEAVNRDEEFARAQESRWRLNENERLGEDIHNVSEERDRCAQEEDPRAHDNCGIEKRDRNRHHEARNIESRQTRSDRIGETLFSGVNNEIEDMSPKERDRLVQHAFKHQALRARRPVIWIPNDELGICDDEILRTQKLSKDIGISKEYTGLDRKGRVVYERSPPDFSEVDLIEL